VTTTTPVPQPADSATRPRLPRRVRSSLTVGGILAAIATAVVLAGLVWPIPPGPDVFHAGTSHYVVTATVDHPKVGASAVEIDVTNRTGSPAHPAAVNIQAVMPQMGHASPPVPAVPLGGGRYHADGVPLMMAGPMELLVSIDFAGGVDRLTLPLTVSG
jgi:hypothetical protein